MDSFQASLWREMAKEAFAAADRIGDLGVRREIFLMAARYMAMAERVEAWTAADKDRTR
jgi:hypothetical protein